MSKGSVQQLLILALCCFIAGCFGNEEPSCDVTTEANSSVIIKCPLPSAPNSVSWMKSNSAIVTDDKYTVYSENGSLHIRKVGETTSGEFVCVAGNTSSVVTVCALPYVQQYDKAKNVIEGDPFQTECHAWGFPHVTVAWHRGSQRVVAEPDKVTFRNGSVENSTMRIHEMQYEDADDYMCIVKSSIGTRNATISVHVKDKFAALWPFIGICVEVFILCVIIFMYERKQAKKLEKEVENAETEYMTANNDVKDELRHRK